MKRTVKEVRAYLRPWEKKSPYKSLSTLTRKRRYGWTKASTERQLQTMDFCGKKIRVHKKVVASLNRVEARIRASEKRGGYAKWTPGRVDTWNWRTIHGGTSLSYHAHAIALDIDPATNKYYPRYTGRPNQTTDIPRRVYKAFLAEAWYPGILWDSPCDVMHFQYGGK